MTKPAAGLTAGSGSTLYEGNRLYRYWNGTLNLTPEEERSLNNRALALALFACAIASNILILPLDYFTGYGPSMLPTISVVGDVILSDCISPLIFGFKRGDVVISADPMAEQQHGVGCDKQQGEICKRIIGIPGDKIHIHGEYRHLYTKDEKMEQFCRRKEVKNGDEEEEEDCLFIVPE
eukprot:CAMPEP_0195535144 /NCGR_PEP_ID=MMETSP0794_2-20130614/43721_1 /TAXON_ID=515487 /ORGANISM="Stephanopyxis turris, Strain CCMP 815" /LENGTH=178 /DNA_ID=CAMNT_0040668197 /DNA_START=385 /DNA_END=918 /DNA_ORIENTATION=+